MDVRRTDHETRIALADEGLDPETTFLVTGLEPGEPVFVIRARDAAALPSLNLYAMMTEGLFSDERALGIEADRNKFIDWRRGPGAATLRDPD